MMVIKNAKTIFFLFGLRSFYWARKVYLTQGKNNLFLLKTSLTQNERKKIMLRYESFLQSFYGRALQKLVDTSPFAPSHLWDGPYIYIEAIVSNFSNAVLMQTLVVTRTTERQWNVTERVSKLLQTPVGLELVFFSMRVKL